MEQLCMSLKDSRILLCWYKKTGPLNLKDCKELLVEKNRQKDKKYVFWFLCSIKIPEVLQLKGLVSLI